MGCAGLSFAFMFLCVETQLGAISRLEAWRAAIHGVMESRTQLTPLVRGKAGGCARVTAGPKRPHLSVCPGPNVPLQGRQGSRGPDPSSKATPWVKAQHEGALPPPCIVRKDPRVPHTARRGA